MGKIFYLMGKSAAGKDSLYAELKKRIPELGTVVLYTTRPMRNGEVNGRQYYFISREEYQKLLDDGKVIEHRDYDTACGLWSYMTVDDGQIDTGRGNYLMIGTPESYESLLKAFGSDKMVPLYITVDDGVRLARALKRERKQEQPKYAEMCRRFLADEEDFAPANLERLGIVSSFDNTDFETTVENLCEAIKSQME